ncbi:MAG: Gfo/Idh/MocA family protein [Alphaproteobacteria bacterium]
MISIGILGAARIAPDAMIAPCRKRSDVSIVAVAARSLDRARHFAGTHGIALALDDYDALVRHPAIDLVYNALPPVRHADLSIAALQAGKAVLCEKPFAMNAGEAETMVAAARRSGGILIEAFHYRYHPVFRAVHGWVRTGRIGTVRRINAVFTVPIADTPGELRHDPRLGGGALMDLGCYPVHWIRTILGAEPVVRRAEATMGKPGLDLAMAADLDGPDGARARVTCSMAPDTPIEARLDIDGTAGSIRVQNPLAPHLGYRVETDFGTGPESHTIDDQHTTYDHQLDAVLEVLAGRTAPLTGGSDALATMALIDGIYRAAGLAPRGLKA